MKKILALVLALMLLVIIPVEAVAATTTNAASKGSYYPQGGTYYGFYPLDPNSSYPLAITFLPADLTADAIICMQDDDVMDYIKDNAKDMTVSAIAEVVGTMLDSKIAEKAVKYIISFSLWAAGKAEVKAMIEAREESSTGKIISTKWHCPGIISFNFYTFRAWNSDYVDYEDIFSSGACSPSGYPHFVEGEYGKYNQYK